jgi:hypothetical protein
MACCGQKRAALTSAPPAAVTLSSLTPPATNNRQPAIASQQLAVHTQPAQPSPRYSSVALRYTETSPILVKGPATGRQYQFSGPNPVQAVDARDAAALLRTRFFSSELI